MDLKVAYQNDRGSDWMLRSDREWVRNGPTSLQAAVGVEWDNNIDCPFIAVAYQTLNWTHIGCAKSFGGKPKRGLVRPFLQVDLRHQVDSLSSWWLRTDHPDITGMDFPKDEPIVQYNRAYQNGTKWTGANPFYHLRIGLEWKRISEFRVKCPVIATGRSLTQGFPYESEHNGKQADLYWSHLECQVRIGGK